MFGVTSVANINNRNNNYVANNQIRKNNNNQKRCSNCSNCKNMYCSSKKRNIESFLEATRCNKFKKIEFSMFLNLK